MPRPPYAAAFMLLLAAPLASASGSSVSLRGPSAVTFADPVEVPVRAHLLLDGVACRAEAEIPVRVRVTRATGADATLEAERFLVRVPAGSTAREGSATLMLSLVPRVVGEGAVELLASYALPPECVALTGPASGEATLTMRVRVVEPSQAVAEQVDHTRPITLKREVPGPIVAAAAAAFGGALLVAIRRFRERRPVA